VFICYLLVNEDEYIRHLYFAIKWQQNFLKEMYKHMHTREHYITHYCQSQRHAALNSEN